jgi:hypothetical protein
MALALWTMDEPAATPETGPGSTGRSDPAGKVHGGAIAALTATMLE